MLDPLDIISSIEKASTPTGINVFWLESDQPRDRLKRSLDQFGSRIVILILKSNLFQNPNTVIIDLIELFTQYKECFPKDKTEQLSILILAKNRLEIAQQSSPASLPSWFPILPGQTAELSIIPLNFSIETSLSEKSTSIALLSSRVFKIEQELIKRLTNQYKNNKDSVISYLNTYGINSAIEVETFLHEASDHLNRIINPESYRISLKADNSLLSRICSKHLELSIAAKPKQAKKLALALGLESSAVPQYDFSLQTLIQRPYLTEDADTSILRMAMDTEELVFFVYQLMNGIAHRDRYPKFGSILLESLCRESVNKMDVILNYI